MGKIDIDEVIETQKELKRSLNHIIEFAFDNKQFRSGLKLEKARKHLTFTIKELTKIKNKEYVPSSEKFMYIPLVVYIDAKTGEQRSSYYSPDTCKDCSKIKEFNK